MKDQFQIHSTYVGTLFVGAGCSQLLSDMQAFKASTEDSCSSDGSSSESSSNKGHLSRRMRKEGNLWRELWETSKFICHHLRMSLGDVFKVNVNTRKESTVATGETKRRFKKLTHIFDGRDKLLSRPFRKDQINDEEKGSQQSLSSFFDRKSSLFSKKPPKGGNLAPAETTHSLIQII
ncbi:Rab3 GTPase-activating protein catalytic subunit [Medicago truncatula]|uniref:Rab3 GTPase-activating protein catalytic subunit n=1 Tax=Medicago truncatula TaxID=3880 RepID=G7IZP7_MEDTR|nr:Rab3 GTPase-activating protein catalytic subunit [Medicago truncatula]